ncbi:MAG TPA: helix-turn-helix domain-containing protein [Candidatus Nanopelagicaceae bacterium]|nr:helix-turn-helix domain-containing protein [Candidatus Nanopelagicaceae bacterium]
MKNYTTKETSKILKCCTKTVLKLIKTGKIEAYKIGYRWRVLETEIEKFQKKDIG